MKREIEGIAEGLVESLSLWGIPYDFLLRTAKEFESWLPEDQRRELAALAEASGTSYESLLAFNCVTDVDAISNQQLLQCSNFALFPSITASRQLIHARNLDFPIPRAINNQTSLIISRTRTDRECPATVGVSWAAYVGMFTGCSSCGLSIGHVVSPSGESHTVGVPVASLMRATLENATNAAEAVGFIKGSRRASGFNILIADGIRRTAVCLECTPKVAALRRANTGQGFLVVDNMCLCGSTSRNRLTYAAGVLRHARVMQLLSEMDHGIDESRVEAMLRDRYDWALGRARGPGYKGYNCIANTNTVHSVIFFPEERRIKVSHLNMPAPNHPFVAISLDDLWGPVKVANAGTYPGSQPLDCGFEFNQNKSENNK